MKVSVQTWRPGFDFSEYELMNYRDHCVSRTMIYAFLLVLVSLWTMHAPHEFDAIADLLRSQLGKAP